MVVGLGRLSGRTVGVLANNPLRLGGCLNPKVPRRQHVSCGCATHSAFRWWSSSTCPAICPVSIRSGAAWPCRGAKLLHAFGESSVPWVTLVTRKIYGGAYIAMNSRSLGATKVFAWPTPRLR